MISESQFKKWITILTTAHSKRLTNDEKSAWFSEVRQCYFEPLNACLPDLKRTEWFPTFKDFRGVYGRINRAKSNKQDGCHHCRGGYIHENQGGYEVLHFCKECHPEHDKAVNPRNAFDYVEGTEPFLHRNGRPMPRTAVLGMIQEFQEKMKEKDINWKQETEEAWAFHKRMMNEQTG